MYKYDLNYYKENLQKYILNDKMLLDNTIQELRTRVNQKSKGIYYDRYLENKDIYEGAIYIMPFGIVKVIEYFDPKNVLIEFSSGYRTITTRQNITTASLKDPFQRNVFGIGFNGVGPYVSSINGKNTIFYNTWSGMLRRCYEPINQQKHPTYIECVVHKDWHNYQNFAGWYDCMSGTFPNDMIIDLDKDILCKGNKLYSEEYCCLVPRAINSCFTKSQSARGPYPIGVKLHIDGRFIARLSMYGEVKHLGIFETPEEAFYAYKAAKEKYIQDLANQYKWCLEPRVYKALMEYEVEITD